METRPNYPHQQPHSSHTQWRENHLYGIAGWFANRYRQSPARHSLTRIATAFSGHFSEDTQTHSINGLLIDQFGSAILTGTKTEDTLIFDKYYFDLRTQRVIDGVISYNFHLDGDKWVGTYSLDDERNQVEEAAQCSLILVESNAFGIIKGVANRSISDIAREAKERFSKKY